MLDSYRLKLLGGTSYAALCRKPGNCCLHYFTGFSSLGGSLVGPFSYIGSPSCVSEGESGSPGSICPLLELDFIVVL